MPRTYRSAVDLWLALILVGLPVGIVAAGVYRLMQSDRMGALLIFEGLFVGGLMALFAVPCIYTLTEDVLHIRCGIMTTIIPLGRIDRVEPSRSLWSGPALSLRRVRIDYGGGERALVSPRERETFIVELQAAVARCRQSRPTRARA